MKGKMRRALLGGLCGMAILAQAAVSWGTFLNAEAQVDNISVNSSLGVTFGDFATSVSGSIYSNGTLVSSGTAASAGSFATGIDGSVGALGATHMTDTQYGYLGTTVFAAPIAANPDPLATPLASDFVVLGNAQVASMAGGKVSAMDTAHYTQTFAINGTGTGIMSLSALGLYNFSLYPDDTFAYTAMAQATLDFMLSDGSQHTYFAKISNPDRMYGQDVLLLGGLDALGNPVLGDLFGPISVLGGSTWTLDIFASSYAEVTSVPEPGTLALLSAGLIGTILFRRRMTHHQTGKPA